MKKLIIGVLVFALISFGVTGVLIKVKNGKMDFGNNEIVDEDLSENNGNIVDDSGNVSEEPKEKTIDLYGTYDENDLIIENVDEKIEVVGGLLSRRIPKIRGLKDKSIETKINTDIKNRILERIAQIQEKEDIININYTSLDSECANFSNVISICWRMDYQTINGSDYEYIYFNYELINGERLKFEDLFTEDADIHSILRQMFYRNISKDYGGEYDIEDDVWIGNMCEYDENIGECILVEKEFVPEITEYDINKNMKSFMNDAKKEFVFTPTRIHILVNEDTYLYSYYLYFKDIADDVVIYDKYVTEESLYETNDIGLKNLWTCSKPLSSFYMNYGFLEENFYYDISLRDFYAYYIESTDYPFKKSLEKIQTKLIEDCKDKLEGYREIAKKNPDKFFVLSIDWNSSLGGKPYNTLIPTQIYEYLTTTDMNYKEKIMNELLESYRYYNLMFYESALDFAGYKYDKTQYNEYYQGNIVFNSFEEKVDYKTYDARTLKEITSIDEIFKNSDAHKIMVIEELKSELIRRKPELSIEEVNSLVEEADFIIDKYGIDVRVSGFDHKIFVMNYSKFNKSILTIYDLDMYIIPDSNTRKIEKSEIQDLSLDDLNRAYNEIFARHGHDFKSKELNEYFELCSWYTPIANKSVTLEELNEIERYNLDIIKNLINEKK